MKYLNLGVTLVLIRCPKYQTWVWGKVILFGHGIPFETISFNKWRLSSL